jgi:hypothetical protein
VVAWNQQAKLQWVVSGDERKGTGDLGAVRRDEMGTVLRELNAPSFYFLAETRGSSSSLSYLPVFWLRLNHSRTASMP